ncbi:cbb3-type cytochrome c oxidase subunit I [Aequorivita echinoideorum]|uniref:Cbb3-type cytochrome c oxidase subunit I n=1 Tax=Aequorivita echinoideorum TaxID=1549647 RepID=A0ABS5S5T9_9FLAO|nr:cbb3-type cytochrome c oxidase subunit I [Aequorivita echinoideorum]MBT0607785.1 cbb3-type cytochrome c oxidase subunit I [Aequorivita echinoideorum]
MNKLIEKPHLIFLLTIPIIMLIGILSRDSVLDINVHDTYYIIAYLHLAILISIFFGIIGIGYWIMLKADRKLSKWLNWTHIGLTFGGTLVVWILTKFYRTEIMEYEFNYNLTLMITLIILLMIVGQLIFPINIIYGLIKKKNKTSG